MAYERRGLAAPAGPDALELKGSRRHGVWWERGDGLVVRVAAPERERVVERARLSLLGVLVACIASGSAPKA